MHTSYHIRDRRPRLGANRERPVVMFDDGGSDLYIHFDNVESIRQLAADLNDLVQQIDPLPAPAAAQAKRPEKVAGFISQSKA